MKVFISQPMQGRSDEDISKERSIIKSILTNKFNCDITIVDSFFKDAPVDAKPLWYLSKSIELLSIADLAYFAHGWDNARGCKIEHACAIEYGIPVMYDIRN